MNSTTMNFLVEEVVEAVKNVVEHEAHFISNFMDEGLSSLAMRTSVFLGLGKRRSELGGVVNKSARGARGDASIGSVGSVWLAFGGVSDNARVVVIVAAMRLFSQSGEDSFDDISMTLVLASFLGGFLVDEEALEAIFESGFRADYVRFLRM
ncbi:hypothetical protein Tco_0795491 [Tanacetum coccineum]